MIKVSTSIHTLLWHHEAIHCPCTWLSAQGSLCTTYHPSLPCTCRVLIHLVMPTKGTFFWGALLWCKWKMESLSLCVLSALTSLHFGCSRMYIPHLTEPSLKLMFYLTLYHKLLCDDQDKTKTKRNEANK
uniref:Uncharacterized protein n=1 Tax=Pipistrellus kuhlii TaxID=59472 RepID=A0A7J8B1T2_PIPKU|nr:hypothetical protein mPipKuh1_007913 [Pipistrellus kuhlii]